MAPPAWRLGLPTTGVFVSRALLAAGLAYLLGYRLHRAASFAWGAGACLVGGVAGHSVGAIAGSVSRLWRRTSEGRRWLVPGTAVGWGGMAVIMAFVLLALGGLASLLKGRDQPPGRHKH